MNTEVDASLEEMFAKAADETERTWCNTVSDWSPLTASMNQRWADIEAAFEKQVHSASAEVVAALTEEEPATKKRKREVKEYEGTEEQFNLAWAKLKSLFHTHPAIFSKWLGEFMTNIISLELKFGLDFYARLKPKQKQVCVTEAERMEKKLERELSREEELKEAIASGEVKKSKTKKVNVMTISPEMYQNAWKAMAFVANPLLSSVEYNFLTNLGLRLREYKEKAIMAPYEQDLLVKLLESVPGRVSLERQVE